MRIFAATLMLNAAHSLSECVIKMNPLQADAMTRKNHRRCQLSLGRRWPNAVHRMKIDSRFSHEYPVVSPRRALDRIIDRVCAIVTDRSFRGPGKYLAGRSPHQRAGGNSLTAKFDGEARRAGGQEDLQRYGYCGAALEAMRRSVTPAGKEPSNRRQSLTCRFGPKPRCAKDGTIDYEVNFH